MHGGALWVRGAVCRRGWGGRGRQGGGTPTGCQHAIHLSRRCPPPPGCTAASVLPEVVRRHPPPPPPPTQTLYTQLLPRSSPGTPNHLQTAMLSAAARHPPPPPALLPLLPPPPGPPSSNQPPPPTTPTPHPNHHTQLFPRLSPVTPNLLQTAMLSAAAPLPPPPPALLLLLPPPPGLPRNSRPRRPRPGQCRRRPRGGRWRPA